MTDSHQPQDPTGTHDSDTADPREVITELVGVYNADGGLAGEARYVFGSWFGRAHCALCDVTHSPFRRKKEWDAMVRTLGVPFSLDHLNDMPRDVAALVSTHGAPMVVARLDDGGLQVLLAPADLEPLEGSVSAFESALRGAVTEAGLHLAHPYRTPPNSP